MATAQTVINMAGSLGRIVNSPGAAVDATTSADMLKHLQGMLGRWSEDGVVEIPPPDALSDTLDESPGALDAISTNLAVRYGQAVGKTLDLWLLSQAKDDKAWLTGRKTLEVEVSLSADGMPSVGRGRYNINTDS